LCIRGIFLYRRLSLYFKERQCRGAVPIIEVVPRVNNPQIGGSGLPILNGGDAGHLYGRIETATAAAEEILQHPQGEETLSFF
jgi:hypothetical protein